MTVICGVGDCYSMAYYHESLFVGWVGLSALCSVGLRFVGKELN